MIQHVARRLVLGLVVGLCAAGCAAIPDSGPVRSVRDSTTDSGSTVRYRPARPADGASPETIVRGFLDAMLAYPISNEVASAYLTSSAATGWRHDDSTTVYSGRPQILSITGAGLSRLVRLRITEDARIDLQGRYMRVGRPVVTRWRLQRVDGQWRLETPPEGRWVSRAWFDDYVQPFDVYFLDASGTRVVPSPVWEVAGDQLATSLVSSLAIGPSKRFDQQLTTALPPLSRMRKSVPVSADGEAQVDFQLAAGGLSTARQERIIAQLAWTMKAAPGISAVQVSADGLVLSPRGAAGKAIDGWDDYGWQPRNQLAVIVDNRVRLITDSQSSAMTGAWGANARRATAFSLGTGIVAAVIGNRALITDRAGATPHWVTGRGWTVVQCVDDQVWLVDQPGRSRIRVADGEDAPARTVDTRAFGRHRVQSFTVSPDGARYAAVLDGSLVFGSVRRDGSRTVSLDPPTRISTTVSQVSSPQWFDGTYITYVGRGPLGRQVYTTRIDGSDTVDSVPGTLAQLVGATARSVQVIDDQVYVLDTRGRVWLLDGPGWRKLDLGTVTAVG